MSTHAGTNMKVIFQTFWTLDVILRMPALCRPEMIEIDPVYMSRKIRKFRTDKFDM